MIPVYPPGIDQAGEDVTDQLFRSAVAIVGTGIDEVDPSDQGFFKRRGMIGNPNIDAVATETDTTDHEACIAQRMVGHLWKLPGSPTGAGRGGGS